MKNLLSTFILLSLCMSCRAQLAVSIDSEPVLGYVGNIIGGSSAPVAWIGSEGIPLGFDIARFRVDKDDWIRYRGYLSYYSRTDPERVAYLDEDLAVISGRFNEDVEKSISLAALFSIEQEKRIGEGRLQGLLGRGIGIGTARTFFKNDVSNPLSAYMNDTLWFDSGYSFSGFAYVFTGVVYYPWKDVSLSGRVNFGLAGSFLPKGTMRVVVEEANDSELESFPIKNSSSDLRMDNFIRPRIVLSFYF